MMDDNLRELIEELENPRHAGSDGEELMLDAAAELTRLSEENERMREEIARLKSIRVLKVIAAPPVTFDED